MALQTVGWLQNAGAVHTAAQFRSYLATLQAANYNSSTTLRARGGIHPSFGQEFVVTQTGSPSMGVLVEAGAASIPGTESATQGNYFVLNDAQVTLSIAAAHASLSRIDIVVVNVRDAFYSGVNNDAQLQVITGTPASSPVAPAAPNNAIFLAQVNIGPGVTSITNANILDSRHYMAAAGGVIKSRNDASRPASTEVTSGQLAWAVDVGKLYVQDGSAVYQQIFPGYNKLAESILGAPAATVTFSSIPSTYRTLALFVTGRGDAAAQFAATNMRFNGDTGANYDAEQMSGNGAAIVALESLTQTSMYIGDLPAATTIAGSAASWTIHIPWYAGTTFWKFPTTSQALGAQTGAGAANALWSKQWAGRWRNTAAINSITLLTGAGNFATGSSFSLYGLP